MEKIQFYPVEISSKNLPDRVAVSLYGRMPEGKQVCIHHSFEPYFYIVCQNAAEVKKVIDAENPVFVIKTEIMSGNYFGKATNAVKVTVKPDSFSEARAALKKFGSILESDVPLTRKYLIDKNITPLTLCLAEGEFIEQRSRVSVFNAESVMSSGTDVMPELRILSVDIETHSPIGKLLVPENPILMIGFSGENFNKVITWKRFETSLDYVEFVESEAQLIEKFSEVVAGYRPDILVGYYSDGFDLPYIRERADKYKIELNLGLDYSGLKFTKGQVSSAYITGITHLDIFKFIKNVVATSLDTVYYDLNAVSKEILNESKNSVNLDNLPEIWDSRPEELGEYCVYNLQDALLAYKLAKKLMPNIIELVKLTGLPIYDVSRMGFSQLVEWHLIKRAPDFNEIIPNKPGNDEVGRRMQNTYEGGFVFEPKPGLYKDVLVFDFRSLYPTIISAHNISPDTLDCGCCKEDAEHWFCKNRRGFVSSVINDLVVRRMRVKEIMRSTERDILLEARESALKTIANAMYGYMGFFGARWYSLDCAKSITLYGRRYIQKVIERAKNEGFNVLYSDSLPYDRYIYVRHNDGEIKLIKIGELYDKYKNVSGISTLAFDKNKKAIFKPIVRVIRHNYEDKLLKINTKYGSTIVTPQHSVYSFDYASNKPCLVDAKNLKKGDKLISLTNPEINIKYKTNDIFDILDFDMGKYSEELYLYSDSISFPAKRGKCPYCEKEYNLAGHIYSKHPERRQSPNKSSLFSWIGGKVGKIRKIPRYWILDEDLAWILGFYCAEGSVSDVKTKSGRKCLLSFGSQDKKLIEKVKLILDAKTNVSAAIIENYDKRINKKMFYYRIQSMPLIALFQYGFDVGKGSEYKKAPWFIFTAEYSLRCAFIKGYLEGDGQAAKDKRYSTHFIRFSTKSKELAIGLDFLFKSLTHNTNFFGKEIKHVSWQYRTDKPKIQTLRLQSAKESKDNFCLAEIRSIEKIPNENYVYDVEVEGTHNFVDAEGMILVHNTDSIFLGLEGKTRENAQMFADSINLELPELMELEFEGFYPVGIFVSAKASGMGAKKKYALLDEKGMIKIRGFETVRRNLSFIARDVQETVLGIILREENPEKALAYVKDVIKKMKNNEIPIEKVIINTQLRKEVGSYDSVSPHVAAAQRMKNLGRDITPGAVVSYVIVQGKERIRDRARLPEEISQGDYDPEYYINNQIVPSVEKIFEVLGFKKEDIVGREQSKLDEFFGK